MPPDLVLLLTLISWNYPFFELILNGPKDVRAIEVRLFGELFGTCDTMSYAFGRTQITKNCKYMLLEMLIENVMSCAIRRIYYI